MKPKTKPTLTSLQIEEKEKAEKQKERQEECLHYFEEVPSSQMLGIKQCSNCGATKYE